MEDHVVAILNAVAAKLQELEVPAEVTWEIVVTGVAEQYGWTLDEASQNMANLLASL